MFRYKMTNLVQNLRHDREAWLIQSDTSLTVNVTSHDTFINHTQKATIYYYLNVL